MVALATTATNIAKDVLNRRWSAASVCRQHVERVRDTDSKLLAFECLDTSTSDRAAAVDDAVQLDATLRLAGVPVGVKSAFSTARLPTTWGTPIHADQVLPEDADLVAALASAGAVIIGKTTLTEYCSGAAPATLNPYDQTRSPGGSSSGSAAAVAAGMVPVALGSQTMGSVIRPASYCGVYGFKPSFGLVSRGGLQRVSDELDTVGWFTNTPRDALLVLEAALDYQSQLIYAADILPADKATSEAAAVPGRLPTQQHPCQFTSCGVAHDTVRRSGPQRTAHAKQEWPFLNSQAVTADSGVPGSLPETRLCGSSNESQPLQGARVARIRCDRCESEASAVALATLDSAEQELQRLGAQVTHITLPPDVQGYFEATQVLMAHGLAAAHAQDYHTHAPRMSPQLQAIFRQGLSVTPDDLAAAGAAQHSTRRFCQALLQPPSAFQPPAQHSDSSAEDPSRGDPYSRPAPTKGQAFHIALSLPVLGAAPLRSEGTGSPRPASLWSLCGAPALAVPWGLSPEGLPLAVQLSAAPGCDRQLLRFAAAVHAARSDHAVQ